MACANLILTEQNCFNQNITQIHSNRQKYLDIKNIRRYFMIKRKHEKPVCAERRTISFTTRS